MQQLNNQQGKKKKIKSKPYITKGIRKSISIRAKLYKEMIKEKNILTKSLKHKYFQKYQNKKSPKSK